METDELRIIVTRHGGTRSFAATLKVSTRIVQYWLAKKRKIRPVIEDRIREMDRTKSRTNRKEHP